MTRTQHVFAALATIAVGLVVHFHGSALGPVARDVLGDALWASMIAWWVAAIAPLARVGWRAAVAYAICVAVEVSQRFHSATLDTIRATQIGHLVLGSGFDPRDLAAYAAGVAFAVLVELAFPARKHHLTTPT